MGLKSPVYPIGFLLLFTSVLQAAPVLRLSSATIGPIVVASAGATNTQTIEVFNAGDGSLNPSVSSAANWVTTTTGASRPCRTILAAVGRTCSTIQVAVSTAGLPQGLSTALVTVSDPNAIDAPQTITVTVRIGTVSVDVAPGRGRDVPFKTTSAPSFATTPANDWLTVIGTGFGSFRFDFPNEIRFRPASTMPQGNYSGSFTISGSSNPAENTTIPISMRVTALPIAVPSADRLVVRLAEGSPALQYPFSPIVSLSNAGQGTLNVSNTAVSGGAWIKQDVVPGFFIIDPAGLAVGTNTGSIVFTSNAVNGTVTVPVELQIVAKRPPSIFFQGVLDNATFIPGDTVSRGDIMVVKGEQLSFSPFTPGPAPPLPTTLGGTSVLVNDTPVPLFYTSYGQIAFQMPVDTQLGTAVVQVKRADDPTASNKASVQVAARAPRLLVVVNQDGSINTAAKPARAGEVLTIYAIGFGATDPAVRTGAAAPSAEPLARVTPTPSVGFGSAFSKVVAEPFFAGLTPTYAGLYQLNVFVPAESPKGEVDLVASLGEFASNILKVHVQ